jgi:2-polyprenyl-3-methyl-5-hydroxy-6-metoxy-1,4-benzoquinol methylase
MAAHPGDQPYSRRGDARTAVVWEALRARLDGRSGLRVLDVGGGTGGFAVRVAALGHHVTVVDPSPDALAILDRRSVETGVADRVVGVQGDLDTVPGLVAAGEVDVVLCHGVLERVDDHAGAVRSLAAVLREGGTLSLLVDQRHAAVVARAVAGHFRQAGGLLAGATSSEQVHRYTVPEATRLLEDAGFTDVLVHGVRVFSDLVPSSLVDLEPGAAAALAELEQVVSELPEYHTLATQIHLLATRS